MKCNHCGAVCLDNQKKCWKCGRRIRRSGRGFKQNHTIKRGWDSDDRQRWILLAGAACVILFAVYVYSGFMSPVARTEHAIDEIRTVSLDSLERIQTAESLYDSLSPRSKTKVENRGMLTQARETYDRMSSAVAEASRAMAAVEQVIYYSDGIPCVDPEQGHLVSEARSAYDALQADGLTDYVADQLPDLEAAEAGLAHVHGAQLLAKAAELERTGQREEALYVYRDLMDRYPHGEYLETADRKCYENLMAMAAAQYKKADYDHAEDLYRATWEMYPDSGDARSGAIKSVLKKLDVDFREGNLEAVLKKLKDARGKYGDSEEYDKYEEKVNKKVQSIRPRNGQSMDKKLKWGQSTFTVSAGGQDALIKVESVADAERYLTFYVRSNETATVNVPDGEYRIKYATGDTWYGKKEMFGENTVFTRSDKTMAFETSFSGNRVWFTTVSMTLYTALDGDLETSPISGDAF